MENLLIIGAGGCGREILQWVKAINQVKPAWNIKGFLDDNLEALNGKKCDISVLSTIDSYDIQPGDVFICGIGNVAIRKMIMGKMMARGAEFVNIIHPTAVLADSCELGNGVVIYPYSIISDNVKIGNGCIVNMLSCVGHDSVLGNYCIISAHCDITGMCSLGDEVFMGSSSKIVPGTKVGKRAFLCAGSVVMTKVKENAKMIGNPARRVEL